MSFKRQFCRLAIPRQVTDPLSVFDDILNDAISRFTLCKFSRRHGSSIPGPLEARRRAAKRRVMNLASPAGVGLDPSCLPGIITPSGWHWQAPGNAATQEPVPQVEDGTHLLLRSMKHMLIKEYSNTFATVAYRDPANKSH